MKHSLKEQYDAALRDLHEFGFVVVPEKMAHNLYRLIRWYEIPARLVPGEDRLSRVELDIIRTSRGEFQ